MQTYSSIFSDPIKEMAAHEHSQENKTTYFYSDLPTLVLAWHTECCDD